MCEFGNSSQQVDSQGIIERQPLLLSHPTVVQSGLWIFRHSREPGCNGERRKRCYQETGTGSQKRSGRRKVRGRNERDPGQNTGRSTCGLQAGSDRSTGVWNGTKPAFESKSWYIYCEDRQDTQWRTECKLIMGQCGMGD